MARAAHYSQPETRLGELAKFALYRTPLLSQLMAPRYRYKVDPAQLAAMVGFIDATRDTDAAIIEIGVAKGDTSAFLLEHLRTTSDRRELLLFDTFAGFTPESIEVEIQRGKPGNAFRGFRYGSERRFAQGLRRGGYSQFRTFAGDASGFDWDSIGPIGAVLLDIDVYAPTRDILPALVRNLVPGGGIIVDDCVPDTDCDGAHYAYREFMLSRGLIPQRCGHKGGLITADHAMSPCALQRASSALS